jgi:hypothetical protein
MNVWTMIMIANIDVVLFQIFLLMETKFVIIAIF